MKEPTATSDASLVRGYAWHIYPDPASPGALAGDSPFNTGDPRSRPAAARAPARCGRALDRLRQGSDTTESG